MGFEFMLFFIVRNKLSLLQSKVVESGKYYERSSSVQYRKEDVELKPGVGGVFMLTPQFIPTVYSPSSLSWQTGWLTKLGKSGKWLKYFFMVYGECGVIIG